jgi:hypothetical protein
MTFDCFEGENARQFLSVRRRYFLKCAPRQLMLINSGLGAFQYLEVNTLKGRNMPQSNPNSIPDKLPRELPMPADPKQDPPGPEDPQRSDPPSTPAPAEVPEAPSIPEVPIEAPFD